MGKCSRWIALLVLGVVACAAVSQAVGKELKVFILAGQSNMVGHGKLEDGRKEAGSEEQVPGGIGSLRWFVNKNQKLYGATGTTPLIDGQGAWLVRDDVFLNREPLKACDMFGPEYAFGHVVGNALTDPVLIIKTAWGGKSLGVDFRSPTSGVPPYKHDAESIGVYYRKMMEIVADNLANFDKYQPALKGCKPVIVGFGWHQGWNDGCSGDMVNEYEVNMVNFIKDVRKELGVPELPFVIANSGMGNPTTGRRDDLCKIQLAIGNRSKHPEFAGTVASIETRGFYRPGDQSPKECGYHWDFNGETHFLLGESMGKAMLDLIGSSSPKKAAASAKPTPAVAAKPVRAARSLTPENRNILGTALKSALSKLSDSGELKQIPLGISPTRARVWLKTVAGEDLTFQIVGGAQTAVFKWSDLSAADHATLSQLVVALKPDSNDAQAMAAVYLESIGQVTESEKYYEKAGKESRAKLEPLLK